MSERIKKLSEKDHKILIGLIRGKTIKELADEHSYSLGALSVRLGRMRKLVEAQTTYELVALEVMNLMLDDRAFSQLLEVK